MVLKILSVAYPFAPVGPDAVGGAEQVLSSLDRALVEAGHRSIVIGCQGSRTVGELVTVPMKTGNIDDAMRQRAWSVYRKIIAETVAREAIDVVHLHGVDLAEYIPESAPTLATLHLPLDWYPSSLFRPRANLWLHCVSDAQHVTKPAGAELLPPIPNGVSPKLFDTHCRKRDYAIMLSRICPEKGVHIALEACHEADVSLLIGGQVFPYEAHQRYFREEVAPRLDDRRRFLGPLGFNRKRRLLAAARCVLIPSLVPETSSLTAIEALACGTPVITFPNGALPFVVTEGKTGFIVSNVRQMAEAIAAAGSIDPAVCKTEASVRFSLGRMVKRYLDVYRRIAAAGGVDRDIRVSA